jgi:aryl-alcohol dehydrogenase-like predicted oxidoreductase
MTLRTRRLGDGGPDVTVVGVGCNSFGGTYDSAFGLEEARAVVDAALDAGVTLFDTADVYGQGRSEEHLGAALEGRRESVVVATKFGMPMLGAPDLPRGSAAYVRWACDQSLRRLGTDWIDLYQQHQPDTETPVAETLGALHELVEAGKVRFAGSSNFSARQVEEADSVARERGLTRLVSAQNQYSLLHREAEEELLPTCERLGIGVLPWYPLARGLLTGKYGRGEPLEGRLASQEMPREQLDRVAVLRRFAEEYGRSLLEVAIGALLATSPVVSVIAGATKPEQVRANVKAAAWEPTAEDLAALKRL